MIRQQFTRGMGLALPALVVAALIAGCGLFNPNKNDGNQPPPQTGDRHTPEHLISYFASVQADPLRQADPNAEEYGRCLHPQYGFFFTDADRALLGEESWTKDRDVAATKDLFGAAMTMTVTMSPEGAALDTVLCDEAVPDVFCYDYSVLIQMTIVAPHPTTHEVTTFRVNGRAEFVITRDTTDSTSYVIREIHDRTDQPVSPSPAAGMDHPVSMAAAAVNDVTWGGMRNILAEDQQLGLAPRRSQ